MDKVDWKGLLARVAPAAATFLGGPLAGAVTQQVSSALLGKPDGSDAELAVALAAPDAAVKLRELELAFEQERNRHAETVMQRDNEDRASARAREIAVQDRTPTVLAYITTGLVACVALGMIFVPVPEENADVLYLVAGQIIVGWLMALTYYYGTTSRSNLKDQTIAAAVRKG